MEKYVARKLFIADSSKILVSGIQCAKYLEDLRDDTIYYCQENNKCEVNGKLRDGVLDINYNMPNIGIKGHFETPFKLLGYYSENSIAASAAALAYGLDENSIIEGLKSFKGIAGHMEYIGNFKGEKFILMRHLSQKVLLKHLKVFKIRN